MLEHGKLLALTLGLSFSLTGCDDSSESPKTELRGGSTIGTGAGLTLNTSKCVSSTARDVYEFSANGGSHHNSFNFDTRFLELSVADSPFGPITSAANGSPQNGQTFARLTSSGFGVEVFSGNGGESTILTGTALIGTRMTFEVSGGGDGYTAPGGGGPGGGGGGGGEDDNVHLTSIEIVSHHDDGESGDLYEFQKIDPVTGAPLGPLCESDNEGQRYAAVYAGLHVTGNSGSMSYVNPIVRHIACTSAAPGKAFQFGYEPSSNTLETFILANRVIRADYCGDGHPYTYPGNVLGIEDNVSPGQSSNSLDDVVATLEPGETVEAVWDAHGVLCMGSPRAPGLAREDVVCPVKNFADGSVEFNWRPPNCEDFTEGPTEEIRYFATSQQQPEE